ncbi:MAG: VWA domain-containing protein, partial [Chloroflexota bacterium]
MALYRYSRWDGTQQVFEPRPDEVLDELSNELTAHGDVQRALRRLFQKGMRNPAGQRVEGLQDIAKRLRQRRKDVLQRHNLDTLMDDLRQKVDQIVKTERQGIQRRLDAAQRPSDTSNQPAPAREQQPAQGQPGQQGAGQSPDDKLRRMLESMAQKKLQALDTLPKDMAGAIKQLQDYDFMDPEARRQFQELMDMLRRRMMDNVFKDLSQRLRDTSPEQMARMREMMRELNQMLRDRLSGGKPDFQQFMDKYGQFFGPEPPQNMDELVEWLQRQIAQAQSLLKSMSPEQRRELQNMLEGMMDEGTRAEMARMASMLDRLYPPDEMAQQYPFIGE